MVGLGEVKLWPGDSSCQTDMPAEIGEDGRVPPWLEWEDGELFGRDLHPELVPGFYKWHTVGQDNAADVKEGGAADCLDELLDKIRARMEEQKRADDDKTSNGEKFPCPVEIPDHTTGPVTFAYQRALKNRVEEERLQKYDDLDMRAYTPTFIHECLMLPGSLASVLGKVSANGFALGYCVMS